MIFLFKWVMCRFKMFILQGVSSENHATGSQTSPARPCFPPGYITIGSNLNSKAKSLNDSRQAPNRCESEENGWTNHWLAKGHDKSHATPPKKHIPNVVVEAPPRFFPETCLGMFAGGQDDLRKVSSLQVVIRVKAWFR